MTITPRVSAPDELQELTPELKVAVTLRAALIVRVQVLEVPLQAPLHPAKLLPPEAVAVSVTLVPEEILAEQVLPHEMPPTLLVTVPEPVPALATESVYELATAVKVAVTERAADIVTMQVLEVPEQAPPHPEKVYPPLAAAVKVTPDPVVNAAAQDPLEQEMPAIELVTEPEPVTATVRVRVLDEFDPLVLVLLAAEAPPPPQADSNAASRAASTAANALGTEIPMEERPSRADRAKIDTEVPDDSDGMR